MHSLTLHRHPRGSTSICSLLRPFNRFHCLPDIGQSRPQTRRKAIHVRSTLQTSSDGFDWPLERLHLGVRRLWGPAHTAYIPAGRQGQRTDAKWIQDAAHHGALSGLLMGVWPCSQHAWQQSRCVQVDAGNRLCVHHTWRRSHDPSQHYQSRWPAIFEYG